LAICLLAVCLSSTPVVAQSNGMPKGSMPRIPAGTPVDNSANQRWNRVVLLSRPSIESGDVDAVSKTIRESASSLVVTILATIESSTNAQGEVRFRMTEIGVGTSAELDGEWKVVTLESANQLGLSFGFIQRQLLYENDKQFRKLQLIAKTTTLAIFDAPTIMLRDGQHRDYQMRHFVWIDSSSGASATLVWLLEQDAQGNLRTIDEPARWLPAGLKEKRVIHVDRDEFTLGIPGARAFGLRDLPPGKPIPLSAEARQLAALPQYSMDELRGLATELNRAIQATQ
jgi:hypothetical protein